MSQNNYEGTISRQIRQTQDNVQDLLVQLKNKIDQLPIRTDSEPQDSTTVKDSSSSNPK